MYQTQPRVTALAACLMAGCLPVGQNIIYLHKHGITVGLLISTCRIFVRDAKHGFLMNY